MKHISFLNSPNLTKVTIRLTGTENPQHVTELPFHHVEELHLIAPDPTYFPPLAQEFSDAVSELAMRTTPRLRTIRVPTILSSKAFHHIADLPNIERIDAQFCLDLDRPYLYEPLYIPSLKTFKARFQGPDAWKFALPRIHTPNLNGMTLKFKENPNEGECRELFDIMVNDGLDKRVSRLSIPRIDAMTGVVLQVLEPLFQFKNLTHVRLGFHCDDPKGCMYMMTDPDAAAIGKALPKIQKLFLGPACKIPNRGVTFKGLTSLSEHCRDLEKLQTHFDLTYSNADELNQRLTEAVAPGTSECKLEEICVGRQGYSNSPDAPLILVLTLDRMFPQLKRINHSYSEQSWRKVQSVLENIRAFQSNYSQVRNAMYVPCSVPFFHRFRDAYRLRQTRDYLSDFVEGAVEQLTSRSHPQRSYFHGPRVLYQRNGFIAYAHRRASTLLERCGERALAHQEIPAHERWWLLVRSLLLDVRFLPISDLRNLKE